MSAKLMSDGLGDKGMSVKTFAERSGVSLKTMHKYCREGKVFGARLHVLTKAWWIYPPAKLLCEPRKRTVAGTTRMSSISPVVVLD